MTDDDDPVFYAISLAYRRGCLAAHSMDSSHETAAFDQWTALLRSVVDKPSWLAIKRWCGVAEYWGLAHASDLLKGGRPCVICEELGYERAERDEVTSRQVRRGPLPR